MGGVYTQINGTLITFWFDGSESFVRWDLIGLDLQTGVQTYQSNIVETDYVDSPEDVFSSDCVV